MRPPASPRSPGRRSGSGPGTGLVRPAEDVCVVAGAVSMEKVEVRFESDHAAVASPRASNGGTTAKGDGGEFVPHIDGDDALTTVLTLDHHFG